ncbi:peptide chain release factor N(5)-glutamine methyltransferase [Pedobacter hartonius]|nr:peptide chain release factor N(5)-glutamine methyltransferase [Pedobacter hartonius]
MTLKQLEKYFIGELQFLYDDEEARQLYELTVYHVSGLNRSQVMFKTDMEPGETQQNSFEYVLAGLKAGRPLQHIIGEAWFCGLKFKVSNAVLIPRPETEELVQWIMETAAGAEGLSLIDIGTGSGCIAVTLKSRLEGLQVDALDISAGALCIARENAKGNAVEINFIQSDILGYESLSSYDFIVSNPPYITQAERKEMHMNVLSHEPHLALFVSDENPLIFYQSIADFALKQLRPKGYLFFEINEYFGKEMVDMLSSKEFTDIQLKKDMQGKDRMIRCRQPSTPGMEAGDDPL